MKPEQDDFQELRRLLALKRNEVPPPGYFEGLSGQVMARIRAGEIPDAPSSFSMRNWVERIWAILEAKPVFAGASAVGLCALLVAGFIVSEENSPTTESSMLVVETAPTAFLNRVSDRQPGVLPSGPFDGSIGLVAPEQRTSLFEQVRPPQILPVNFIPSDSR